MTKLYAIAFLLRDNAGIDTIHATLGSGTDIQALVDLLAAQWARKGYTTVACDIAEAPQYFVALVHNDFKIADGPTARKIPIRRTNS